MGIIQNYSFMSLISKFNFITKNLNAVLYIPVRNRGVKKKLNPDNVKPKRIANSLIRGFQVNDGEYVYKNDILVIQAGMEVYPGKNVFIHGSNWELRAITSGYAIITTETLNPYPDSPIYDLVTSGKIVKKPFIHVLEDHKDDYFRLKYLLK